MADLPFLTNSNGPAWLPGAAKEARQFAYWGQLILVAMFIIAIVLAIVAFAFSSWASGVYFVISAVVDAVLLFLLNSTVFEPTLFWAGRTCMLMRGHRKTGRTWSI
jgi:maltodextrin utilization protein YvdJ